MTTNGLSSHHKSAHKSRDQDPKPSTSRANNNEKPGPSSKVEPSSNVEEGFKCRSCGEQYPNRGELYRHRLNQHGGGDDLQEYPWENNQAPWQEDSGEDALLRYEYKTNEGHILRRGVEGQIRSDYNFPTNDLKGGVEELMTHVRDIFNRQTTTFKLNLSLGYILRNSASDNYRYFIAHNNITLLETNSTVTSVRDLRRIRQRLEDIDISTYAHKERPNTEWKVILVTNVVFHIYRTSFPLGHGEMPDFIKQSKVIVTLDKNQNNKVYNDNLCAFRCLATYHNQTNLPESVKSYYEKWCDYMSALNVHLPENPKKYEGIELEDFPNFEKCFHLQITVCKLIESGTVIPRYHPTTDYNDRLYMNIYKGSFQFYH